MSDTMYDYIFEQPEALRRVFEYREEDGQTFVKQYSKGKPKRVYLTWKRFLVERGKGGGACDGEDVKSGSDARCIFGHSKALGRECFSDFYFSGWKFYEYSTGHSTVFQISSYSSYRDGNVRRECDYRSCSDPVWGRKGRAKDQRICEYIFSSVLSWAGSRKEVWKYL